MKRFSLKQLLLLSFFSLLITNLAMSQGKLDRDEIRDILKQFKNYRYGDVSIFEVRNTDELKESLKSSSADGSKKTTVSLSDCMKELAPDYRQIILDCVINGMSDKDCNEEFLRSGKTPPPDSVMTCAFLYFSDSLSVTGSAERLRAYLITTPVKANQTDSPSIIGFVYVINTDENDSEDPAINLKTIDAEQVYSLRRLDTARIFTKDGEKRLKDVLEVYIVQENIIDKSFEAKSIDATAQFAEKAVGNSKSLITNEGNIKETDTQQFIRISDGQPEDYKEKQNEVTLGTDVLRWRKYNCVYQYDKRGQIRVDSLGNKLIDELSSSNNFFTKIGVEAKYGIEEINYPSFWSNRLTINALVENFKIGIIVPPTGWSITMADLFNQETKLTNTDIGLSFEGDFPIKVMPKTGVFHLKGAYVFGDAYNKPEKVYDNGKDCNYLIRANAQLHYTFGVKVDENYLFRFGLGGTLYSVESWSMDKPKDPNSTDTLAFQKIAEETVGNISIKFEFMLKSATLPMGASLQYFDESISANIWAQAPIIDNLLYFRFDLNGYFAAFKNNPRLWENQNVFIPTGRFIIVL